ncbi:hypothetical protein ACOSP7_021448 [Xanthoceras sorbifolium]
MASSNLQSIERSVSATKTNGIDSSQQKSQLSSFSSSLNLKLPIKLDHTNYNNWRMQVLPAIRAFDLEDFVLNCTRCPEKFVEVSIEGSTQPEKERCHVHTMKSFSEALGAAGHYIAVGDLISSVLGGLDDPVVVTITTKQSHINLQEVQFLLMSYESRLAQHNTVSAVDLTHASANYFAYSN